MNFIPLIISIIIPLAGGTISSFLSGNTGESFRNLNLPDFAPPGWIFAPVWTILYIMMGIAAYLVWKKGKEGENVTIALILYGLQLVFNFIWTPIFFGLEMRGLAFGVILILLVLIILTAKEFYNIDKRAGYLMIPYILWVLFATVLNYSIWQINL